jgi:hypothetical protein
MIARLYRGPADGKRFDVPDHQRTILFATFPKGPLFDYGGNAPTVINHTQHEYRMTRHTHPDGSVYFEWSQPRGTRIK